jgi:hypothetical protein
MPERNERDPAMKRRFVLAFALGGLAVWALAGCQSKTAPETAPVPKAAPQADVVVLSKMVQGVAEKLSDEDRALADKQAKCPVTDQALGSMGEPIKMKVKGRIVFLCCEGCVPAIEKDPDKFLAKLDAAGK